MIYVPDPEYNPEHQVSIGINARTRLAPGISMARFLGGYGDKQTMDHISDPVERLSLAKQYYMQAQVLKIVSEDISGEFAKHKLLVAEGLYKPLPGETLDINSINYYMSNGQAVVYELIDQDGNNAAEKTFDLAIYLKDNVEFEKMILDYDSYDPNGELNAQIVMIMPKIRHPWAVTYQNKIETQFNNYVQSTNELVEILEI